jgi:hypothetical protein
MLRLALGLGLLACSFSAVGQELKPSINSGAFLYEACQLRVKYMNDPNAKLDQREVSRALMCDQYVNGFIDGAIASGGYCLQKVTREDAIRKYVAFMTEYPLFLKEDKMMSMALVLQPLFKCPAVSH